MYFWLAVTLIFGLGLIVSSLLLLKHTAKMKMPSQQQRHSTSEQDKQKPD